MGFWLTSPNGIALKWKPLAGAFLLFCRTRSFDDPPKNGAFANAPEMEAFLVAVATEPKALKMPPSSVALSKCSMISLSMPAKWKPSFGGLQLSNHFV